MPLVSLTLPARHSLVLVALMAAADGAGAQLSPVATPPPAASRPIDAMAIPTREPSRPDQVRELLTALAADSMEGRATGAPGSARAARFIAERTAAAGRPVVPPANPPR